MANYFKEAKLSPGFCREDIKKIKQLIENSTTFSVCGMPSMGISIFLRYLATQNFAHFVHIDINELPKLLRKELFKLLHKELKQSLEELVKKKRVVIIFNRFDRLKGEFDEDFFSNLRSIRDTDKEKVVMVFAVNKPLLEQVPKAVSGGNLNMFSKTFYLKPYAKEDLKKLILLNAPKLKNHNDFAKALELSGGHYQLLQLLLKSDSLENPLQDPGIKFQLRELYNYILYPQRKLLQKIAFGKTVQIPDRYLIDVGFVKKNTKKWEIFSELFTSYIKSSSRFKLPLLESRLFTLLKSKTGKVVTKDEIFKSLWNEGGGSDWALNALIYRIRKNPGFISSGYVIENQKKSGYILIRN